MEHKFERNILIVKYLRGFSNIYWHWCVIYCTEILSKHPLKQCCFAPNPEDTYSITCLWEQYRGRIKYDWSHYRIESSVCKRQFSANATLFLIAVFPRSETRLCETNFRLWTRFTNTNYLSMDKHIQYFLWNLSTYWHNVVGLAQECSILIFLAILTILQKRIEKYLIHLYNKHCLVACFSFWCIRNNYWKH